MLRYFLLLFTFSALAGGQGTPSIAAITNSALPSMDLHLPTSLKARSMATIFGANLSTATASTAPPWVKTLGGTEVHLIPLFTGCGTINPPSNLSCELVADLIFVSPTQINFVVPDVLPSAYGQQELVLEVIFVQNGQRFDGNLSFYVSPGGDFAVFQVGYDCQFTTSLSHPNNCGYSQASGQNRVPIGAVTDGSGNLVTSLNPIHQGQVVVLWATGLGPLTMSSSGLLQENNPAKMTFPVMSSSSTTTAFVLAQTPFWVGESPQYEGLDQINLTFPTCTGAAASTEQRYDILMSFQAPSADKNLGIGFASLYMPFIISSGEPTCQSGTAITLSSDPNPSALGQSVTFTATILPATATGTVTFSELTCSPAPCSVQPVAFGTGQINGGTASLTKSSLAAGSHQIVASYSGDTSSITSAILTQIVGKAATTLAVTSTPNPSIAGEAITFTITVSPVGATGLVSGPGSCLNLPLSNGRAQCSTTLNGPPGTQQVTFTYSGDSNYNGSTATIAQVVKQPTSISLTSSANPSIVGQAVTFTAFVTFTSATGMVTFYDGGTTIGSGTVSKAQATFTTSGLAIGSHIITATYSGDNNYGESVSNSVTQIVKFH